MSQQFKVGQEVTYFRKNQGASQAVFYPARVIRSTDQRIVILYKSYDGRERMSIVAPEQLEVGQDRLNRVTV